MTNIRLSTVLKGWKQVDFPFHIPEEYVLVIYHFIMQKYYLNYFTSIKHFSTMLSESDETSCESVHFSSDLNWIGRGPSLANGVIVLKILCIL